MSKKTIQVIVYPNGQWTYEVRGVLHNWLLDKFFRLYVTNHPQGE